MHIRYATRLFGVDAHCEEGGSPKVALPSVVIVMGNSLPVRKELATALSWALASRLEAGQYQHFVDQAK